MDPSPPIYATSIRVVCLYICMFDIFLVNYTEKQGHPWNSVQVNFLGNFNDDIIQISECTSIFHQWIFSHIFTRKRRTKASTHAMHAFVFDFLSLLGFLRQIKYKFTYPSLNYWIRNVCFFSEASRKEWMYKP